MDNLEKLLKSFGDKPFKLNVCSAEEAEKNRKREEEYKRKEMVRNINIFMQDANQRQLYNETNFYTPELVALGHIYRELKDLREAVNIVMARQEIEQMDRDLAKSKLSEKWYSGKKIRRPMWLPGDYISQQPNGEWYWENGKQCLLGDTEDLNPDGWEIYKEEV